MYVVSSIKERIALIHIVILWSFRRAWNDWQNAISVLIVKPKSRDTGKETERHAIRCGFINGCN